MQILDNEKDKIGTLCASVLAKGCNGNQEIYRGGGTSLIIKDLQ